MRNSVRTGVSFGLTSAVITSLGLIVGLHSGTHSRMVVLGGLLSIAVADAFSDALGIHVSEESKQATDANHVWLSTAVTLLSKFFFALTFAVPILLLPLYTAVVVSVVWGISALAALSYFIARLQDESPWKSVAEHVLIGIAVIAITHWVGSWVGGFGD